MEIMAKFTTPTRKDLIPTGVFESVAGTPNDFTEPVFIGERIAANGEGFDANWALHADGIVAARRMSSSAGQLQCFLFQN